MSPLRSRDLLDAGPGLDPISPVPLYRQLRDRISELLGADAAKPGTMLPGEHKLCEQYGVSRTVVRKALSELEADGLVERVKGKGTFASRRHTSERLAHSLAGLHDEATARGSLVRSVVRRFGWETPSLGVASALKVVDGGRVLVLERLRVVDGEPWSLTTTWLPARFADLVLEEDFTTASLYGILRKHGIHATSGTRAVEAEIADSEQADLLDVHAGAPLLVLYSVSYDQDLQPMEVFVARHRGDRSRFEFQLGIESGGPPVPGPGDPDAEGPRVVTSGWHTTTLLTDPGASLAGG